MQEGKSNCWSTEHHFPQAGFRKKKEKKINTSLLYCTAFFVFIRQAEGLSIPSTALAENG